MTFRVAELAGGETTDRRFRNQLDIARIARDCAQWLRDNAEVRAVTFPTPQNLIHVANRGADAVAISGSSPFTSSGLGFTASPRFDMNTLFTTQPEVAGLLAWFDSIWNAPDLVRDVKPEVLAQIEAIYRDKSPELIYFLTLYHVFSELRDDLDEERIVKTGTGIRNTVVWKKLYKFQRDGVVGAIDKLERLRRLHHRRQRRPRQDLRGAGHHQVLRAAQRPRAGAVPKRLRDNWTLYKANDRRNLLAADRFNYDVLNHTDLSRDGGMSGDIDLATSTGATTTSSSSTSRTTSATTRRARMADPLRPPDARIIKEGVKTRVLMLSATPVNNRLADLKNQIAFVTEGDDALHGHGIAQHRADRAPGAEPVQPLARRDADEPHAAGLLEALASTTSRCSTC